MKEKQNGLTWNLGGFIGSAFGIGSAFVLPPFLGNWPPLSVFVAFAYPLFLIMAVHRVWSMRQKWSALRGMNVFLATAFAISLHFLLYAHFNELPIVVSSPPTRLISASDCFPILLSLPALALLFLLQSELTKLTNKPSPNTQ